MLDLFERWRYGSEKPLRQALCRITGVWPHDMRPYRLALRHKGGTGDNNERLEFLGDAILSAVVADVVYRHFERGQEGMLTKVRSRIVSRETLNRIAHEIGLTLLISNVQPEQMEGTSVPGNALEALIGAVYLDRGYDGCQSFIRRRLIPRFGSLEKATEQDNNYKSRLQEFCQKRHLTLEYKVEDAVDRTGQKAFRATVVIGGQDRGSGIGTSKKAATQDAAHHALTYYERRRPAKKGRETVVALALLLSLPLHAQQDAAMSHYWRAQSLYNPAATAMNGMLDVNLMYAMQMTGFTHAPATMTAQADLPLFFISNSHSAGLLFSNDQIGLFTHMKLAVSYAYHRRWGRGTLSGGVRAGLLQEGFDGSKLDLIDSSDPAFPTSKQDGTGFDIDAGLRYDYRGMWHAGVAMHHITSPSVNLGEEDRYEYRMASTMYLMGGWNHALSQQSHLYLDAMVRTDLAAWRGDITARLQYTGERWNMYGGIGYSPTNSVTLLLGTRFHDINIGYAYEAYTSSIGMLHGSHEISLGYQMDLSRFKKGRNLHKSVRLL